MTYRKPPSSPASTVAVGKLPKPVAAHKLTGVAHINATIATVRRAPRTDSRTAIHPAFGAIPSGLSVGPGCAGACTRHNPKPVRQRTVGAVSEQHDVVLLRAHGRFGRQ